MITRLEKWILRTLGKPNHSDSIGDGWHYRNGKRVWAGVTIPPSKGEWFGIKFRLYQWARRHNQARYDHNRVRLKERLERDLERYQ